jgi:predicted metal-dependent HD superfamily phosphohydrolase
MLQLQHEWEQLLHTFGIEQTKAQTVFTALSHAYSSPGRVYHTLDHIQAMLEWINRLHSHATDLPAIQFAAWFHDSIYNPHAPDNEERSAIYAQSVLSSLALPSETIQTVSRMILSTKTHWAEDPPKDCQILLDADLAILGAPVLYYDAYAQAIRQEYNWIPDISYRTARVQVLQTFLQRARIYWTEPMYAALEGQAKENIRREIASLS